MLHMYALKVMSFLESLNKTDNIMLRTLSSKLSTDDVSRLALMFNSNLDVFKSNYRTIIRLNFDELRKVMVFFGINNLKNASFIYFNLCIDYSWFCSLYLLFSYFCVCFV